MNRSGLLGRDLADRVNATPETISRVLNGRLRPGIPLALRIASAVCEDPVRLGLLTESEASR